MLNTGKLAGKTIFISGASRGIGKAIALKAAQDGANIVIAAKTAEPHPKLPGTIYTAGEEAYTIAKYGMSMCVLGMAEEFKDDGVALNALWPKAAIETAAMEMLAGGDALQQCRKTDIMSDAAYVVLTRNSKSRTGEFLIDEDILRELLYATITVYKSPRTTI